MKELEGVSNNPQRIAWLFFLDESFQVMKGALNTTDYYMIKAHNNCGTKMNRLEPLWIAAEKG